MSTRAPALRLRAAGRDKRKLGPVTEAWLAHLLAWRYMSATSDYIKIQNPLLLWLYRLCLLVWIGVPFLVWLCLMFSDPGGVLESRGKILIGIWVFAATVTCLALGGFLVNSSVRPELAAQAQVIQCLFGVFFSLVSGLPSMLLGTLPYIATEFKSLERLYLRGNTVDLSNGETCQVDEDLQARHSTAGHLPVRYVLAIDVSQSFLTDQHVSEEVAAVVHSLFGPGSVGEAAISQGSSVHLYLFAGEWKRMYRSEQQVDGDSSRDGAAYFLGRDNMKELLEQVRISELYKPGETNILGFFEEIADKARAWRGEGFSAVRIIVLSDLMHSIGTANADELSPAAMRVAGAFRSAGGAITLVGFNPSAKADGPRVADAGTDFDLKSALRTALTGNDWQEVDIATFLASDPADRLTRFRNLYGHVIETRALELKYLAPFGGRPLRSYLKLPCAEDSDDVLLRLQCPTGVSAPVKIWIGGNSPGAFALSPEESRHWKRLKSSSNPMPVELTSNYYGVPEGLPPALIVAFPGRSEVYYIQLNIDRSEHLDLAWLWWIILPLYSIPSP